VVCLSGYARHSGDELLPLSERDGARWLLHDGLHQLIKAATLENEEGVVAFEVDGVALEAES
jgi:hypothetical protein